MPRKLAVNWDRTRSIDFNKALKKYKRYLEDQGLRNSTIEEYIGNAGRYLRFAKTDRPSMDDYENFRESLHEWKLSRSTINQYNYAIRAYHRMLGEKVSVTRLEPNNKIPISSLQTKYPRYFPAIHNLKHLAMLKTLF